MTISRVVSILLLGLAVAPGLSAELVRGDVVRSADPLLFMCPTPPRTAAYTSQLEFKSYVNSGMAIGFDSVGNLYSVDGSTTLQLIDPTLQSARIVQLREPATAVAVDAAGYSYVVGISGNLAVYSPGGVAQRTVMLPNFPADGSTISIDVTPNGCTLVYTGQGGSANRFDTCAMLPLPSIESSQHFHAIRALSDGGLAAATDDHVLFFDASGRLVYQVLASTGSPIMAIAFDIDPQFLWIASARSLERMRISDHAISVRTMIQNPTSVAVFGERRPESSALPTQAPARRRAAAR